MYPIDTINFTLALGTLGLQIFAAAFLALYFLQSKFPDLKDIGEFLSRWGLWIGLLLSVAGIVLTLFYSEVLGFEPCFLCWWQRMALYPQALIFAIALWSPAYRAPAWLYSIVLSVFGAVFAIYHHLMQVYPAGNLPCSAQGPSCAQITFIEFGYVTYPMMALSLFAFLIVLMLFVKKRD